MARIEVTGLDKVAEFIKTCPNVIVIDGIARYAEAIERFTTATATNADAPFTCSEGHDYEVDPSYVHEVPPGTVVIDVVAQDVVPAKLLEVTDVP